MSPFALAFLALLFLALVIVVVVDRVLRPGLTQYLSEWIRLPAGVQFYARVFVLVLALTVMGTAVDPSFNLQANAHFMEYVWAVGSALNKVFENVIIVLLVYLGLLTVLGAALRPRQ